MSDERNRQLDAEVAESVMGFEVFDLGYYGTEQETPRMRELHSWLEDVGIQAVGRYAIDVEQNFWQAMATGFGNWSPSTDISAAFTVVEKMRERYTNVSIHAANGWGVSFGDIKCERGNPDEFTERWTPTVSADTLPEAICRAALAAVEES